MSYVNRDVALSRTRKGRVYAGIQIAKEACFFFYFLRKTSKGCGRRGKNTLAKWDVHPLWSPSAYESWSKSGGTCEGEEFKRHNK